MDATAIIEWITQFGLEYFQVYPGLYRGIVTRVDDPEAIGRIQAHVPQVGQSEAPAVWIPPAFNGAGANRGSFWPPEVGDSVYVSFQQGNPGRPQCYIGGWFGGTELPSEFAYTNDRPETRGWITRRGHSFVFKDTPGEEAVTLTWHKDASAGTYPGATQQLSGPDSGAASSDRGAGETASLTFNSSGSVEIENKSGSRIVLDSDASSITIEDSNGNSIVLDSSGATIKSNSIKLSDQADSPGMPFTEWFQWALSHQHPSSTGPTGPPVTPPPNSIASQVVTLK